MSDKNDLSWRDHEYVAEARRDAGFDQQYRAGESASITAMTKTARDSRYKLGAIPFNKMTQEQRIAEMERYAALIKEHFAKYPDEGDK